MCSSEGNNKESSAPSLLLVVLFALLLLLLLLLVFVFSSPSVPKFSSFVSSRVPPGVEKEEFGFRMRFIMSSYSVW